MKTGRRTSLVAALLTTAAFIFGSCHRAQRFEHDFEQDRALDQFEWKCRTLCRISPEHATSGSRSLEISFYPAPEGNSDNYPGISFSKFDRDWTRYRSLDLDVFNPEVVALPLVLRIDDREASPYADRFNRSLVLSPGANRISIPLAGLVTSGTKRELDLRSIGAVLLFHARPQERHTLYLDHLRLE